MGKTVLEEIRDFTLNCEENLNGGISIGTFLRIWSVVHVEGWRRGDHHGVFGGNLMVVLPCM
jgi:hypothetical protein